jgi:hypothetical protein
MISNPKNPYWLSLMQYIIKNYNPEERAIINTGPMALTMHWEECFDVGGKMRFVDKS